MTVNPSEAGPYEIGLKNDLASGATRNILFSEVSIRGKRGYLKKLYGNKGGLDFVFITNSGSKDAKVSVSGGGGFTVVPSATSVNIDGPVSAVTVANESSGTIAASDLNISVGNGVRESGGFSPAKAVSDIVPGF